MLELLNGERWQRWVPIPIRMTSVAAHTVRVSPTVWIGSLGRVTVQSAVLFALLRVLRVKSPFAQETLVCCSFPLGPSVVLLAAKYKAVQAEAASMLFILTLAFTIPAMLWLSS